MAPGPTHGMKTQALGGWECVILTFIPAPNIELQRKAKFNYKWLKHLLSPDLGLVATNNPPRVEDVWHLDSFRKNIEQTFMFDNKCKGAEMALLRINRFYVSMGLDKKGGDMEIATSLRQISDHFLVVLWIHPNILPRHAPKEFFNTAQLKDSEHHTMMVGRWQEMLAELKGQDTTTNPS